VTSIKIDGVLHEFSTIPVVIEDVTEIILNIKELSLNFHGEGPKVIYIDAREKEKLKIDNYFNHRNPLISID